MLTILEPSSRDYAQHMVAQNGDETNRKKFEHSTLILSIFGTNNTVVIATFAMTRSARA